MAAYSTSTDSDADPQPEADGMGASDSDTSSISHGEPIPSWTWQLTDLLTSGAESSPVPSPYIVAHFAHILLAKSDDKEDVSGDDR